MVDLEAKDVRGYLALIKSPNLDSTVCGLGSYVKKVVCEFYSNLHGKKSKEPVERVTVFVKDHVYEFSPKAINKFLGLLEYKNNSCTNSCSKDGPRTIFSLTLVTQPYRQANLN